MVGIILYYTVHPLIEVSTTFRDVFGQLVGQLLWSDGKICRKALCFTVKSMVSECFGQDFPNSIDQPHFHRKIRFVFFKGDSGDSWPPLDAGGTGSML